MTELRFAATSHVPIEQAWAAVTDLSRFDEWLSLHDGWRSDLPEELAEGQRIESVIRAKGIRNRIAWTIRGLRPPHHASLVGEGVGGTAISLTFTLDERSGGTEIAMLADFRHPMLKGPLGGVVARTIKGDLDSSMKRLAAIVG
jgi:uncharacterized protein YndB with AHSA1/START domain